MARIAKAYILAKNEFRNIRRSVAALVELCIPTVVLDSGSSDGTQSCAREAGAEVQDFVYVNHCDAYNTILMWHEKDELVIILDADMQLGRPLVEEVCTAFANNPNLDVAIAPLMMYWDGMPLKYCNLCPPKTFAFRGGRELFLPAGHGERLVDGAATVVTRSSMVHDDRKPLELVLANQVRYARDTVRRSLHGNLRFKDKLRLRTPIYMLGLPLFAFIFRGGFLAGRAGIVYALDRLIAEALTLRAAHSRLTREEIDKDVSSKGK